jgi:hypothetical protein
MEKRFFDVNLNKQGKGINHTYEVVERKGRKLIIDSATGLTWQQSGSPDRINYADPKKYIQKLNNDSFTGFNDWRLPTLEEAMSLMEPTKKNGALYIDPLFDSKQRWIWTADKKSSGSSWRVYFNGDVVWIDHDNYVRAVRSRQ